MNKFKCPVCSHELLPQDIKMDYWKCPVCKTWIERPQENDITD